MKLPPEEVSEASEAIVGSGTRGLKLGIVRLGRAGGKVCVT